MFRICGGKGFHITFDNGWTVSVQFGGGNYSGNYDFEIENYLAKGLQIPDSPTAEIAAWDKDKKWHEFQKEGYTDTVAGWQTPAEVLRFINMIAGKEPTP